MQRVADLKPIYLVHGDDDAKIDEWRTRLRRRAEAERGPGGLDVFDARSVAPSEVVASLASLTFETGTRYLLVDDAGAWKAKEIEPLLEALGQMPPDTVLMLVVRGKPLKGLLDTVGKAGGEAKGHEAPKPWEMPRWVLSRAGAHGLEMDAEAAKTLLAAVGPGQTRIERELEKLAIALHPGNTVDADAVAALCGGETAPKVYDLADAVVAGDVETTLTLAEELAAQDEQPNRFVYPIVSRLREVRHVLELLESGVAESEMPKALGAPPWRVKKAIALARKADRETVERALCRFADLELDLRGGGVLDEDTAVTLALVRSAA